jgi:hypothetical protein
LFGPSENALMRNLYWIALAGCLCHALGAAAGEADAQRLEQAYVRDVLPLVKQYCSECHSAKNPEADLDLTGFATWTQVRKSPKVWQKVGDMLATGQMPPKEAKQPNADEQKRLKAWVESHLRHEAAAHAGDPGRVVLRRLNNAEYTYTLRDLTGVPSLTPAKEFPVDGAAGEGFTNTGNALVMSPALVTKYLDAAKEVANHAVLLPDGFRFSQFKTRADWTHEKLERIREFYRQYTDASGGEQVNLQGIVFSTNEGGRLPVEKYVAATLQEREVLEAGKTTLGNVASKYALNEKYLTTLWNSLHQENSSLLLDRIRDRWQTARPNEAAAVTAEIVAWQKALWRFTTVGHIGKVGGPKAWQEPVSPLATRQELKWKPPATIDDKEIVLYLAASDAGDGNEHDFVVWERPRLVAPGRPDLLLRDMRRVTSELTARRERLFASTAQCLAAAAEASGAQQALSVEMLAAKYAVPPEALAAWLDYLGIGIAGSAKIGDPIVKQVQSAANYDFVQGWVGDNALSIVANSSDQQVRIPGNMAPHSVAVHPTPNLQVAVGWKCPAAGTFKIEGSVQHAHPECGNGVVWTLELRRGNTRLRLAGGIAHGANKAPIGPFEKVAIQKGDFLSLVIGPRDSNHSCDLTAIDLTLHDGQRAWNLAKDLSPNILAGNPHADSHGNQEVWHFYSEPTSGASGPVIPAGTLLAQWQAAADAKERQRLADALQKLLTEGPARLAKDAPDTVLYQQLTSFGGPLLSAALKAVAAQSAQEDRKLANSSVGLAPDLFGKHPDGSAIDSASLCVRAPSVLEIRLPADLLTGAEFVTGGALHQPTGKEGSVQLQVLTTKPDKTTGLQTTAVAATNAGGAWTANSRGVTHATPVVTTEGSAAHRRMEKAFADFRQLFPSALCYTKIVPVDEVVTLTLYYREDDQLARLMLNDSQRAQLDRLWDELHFISHDAEMLVDALEQLIQYATQDADPKVFTPLREPFAARASAYRQRLIEAAPRQIDALIEFASQAYRRPLSDSEGRELRALYARLRAQDISHDDAFRLTLARVFVAPAFLYRAETPVHGTKQGPVSGWELASRLSYFLWSSQPDEELRKAAAQGELQKTEVLLAQMRRMLKDAKTRRLATEFACQWLHIYEFDQHNEKSDQHFPTFAALRGPMYEESIQFFTDLFQNDRSVLGILNADYTFLNEELAKHYNIAGVEGTQWRRVEGVQKYARGGILAQGTTLTMQSGASRTSPILRGNWISEVLLGERLPRPPPGIPQLPEDETATDGFTVRELVEKHSIDPKCVVCHERIDPLGFSLEGFDAIGRRREKDLAGRKIETHAKTLDGAEFSDLAGLRSYLVTKRRDAFLRQFCKKLLGYALGRSVQLSDEPLLAEMQSQLTVNEYRAQVALELLIRSRQFREIRGREMAYDE